MVATVATDVSKEVGHFLRDNKLLVTTAESCTAGLICSMLGQTPDSSSWLDSGFVVYSPDAKHESLGVKFETIEAFDITSVEVAQEMALGALNKASRANLSVSTTGLAGPTGGTKEIPVGTVCFAWAYQDRKNGNMKVFSEKRFFEGDRNEIRSQAAVHSLQRIEHYYHQLPKDFYC